MKKRIIMTAVVLTTSLMMLTSCDESYSEANSVSSDFGKGYFTTIKEWDDGMYRIAYANDTGVMYMIVSCSHRFGITPLYNADGTLQIYEEN